MCVCLFTYLVNCATTYEISYSAVNCVACFLCCVNICLLIRIYPPPSPLCSMFWEADLHSWTPSAGISTSHFRVFYLSLSLSLFFFFCPLEMKRWKIWGPKEESEVGYLFPELLPYGPAMAGWGPLLKAIALQGCSFHIIILFGFAVTSLAL